MRLVDCTIFATGIGVLSDIINETYTTVGVT